MAGGQLGKFGKLSTVRRLKPSKLVLIINNPLTDLLIHQTFFRQMLEMSQFAKLSLRQTFPLYDTSVAISKLYLNNKTNLNNIVCVTLYVLIDDLYVSPCMCL